MYYDSYSSIMTLGHRHRESVIHIRVKYDI
jgi:hypothetical protein